MTEGRVHGSRIADEQSHLMESGASERYDAVAPLNEFPYNESLRTYATSVTDQAPLMDNMDEDDDDDNDDDNVDEDGAPPRPAAHPESISTLQAAINLFKSNIGTGILAMPFAFRSSGLGLGPLLIVFMGFTSLYCMHQLRRCGQFLRERHNLDPTRMDYGETAKAAFVFGPVPLHRRYRIAKYTVNGFIVVVQFGFCCVYVLFMAQNLQSFVKQVANGYDMGVTAYAAIIYASLLPYCVVKKLRKLTKLSYAANVMTVFALILILVYSMMHLRDWREFSFANDPKRLPIALGIMMYSFESISLVLPIENKMRRPRDYGGPCGVLNSVMLITIIMYVMVGFFGYLGFGEDTDPSVTVNIPGSPWIFAFVKPMFIVCMYVSYGIQFYVPAYVLLRPVDKRIPDRQKRKWVNRAIKVLMITMTFGVASSIPHLDLLISLFGALLSSALALIFPPIIELVTYWALRDDFDYFYGFVLKNISLIIFGMGCLIYSTAITLQQIIEAFQ